MPREPGLTASGAMSRERRRHAASEGQGRPKRASGDGAWAAPKRRETSNQGPRSVVVAARIVAGEIDVDVADHHLFPGLLPPHDVLRRVGIGEIGGGVVEERIADDP